MGVAEVIRRQDGLITRKQAAAHGLSKGAIERRLARGDWTRVRPTVFLSAEHPFTARARVRAAVLWLGDDATLIGAGAAWWWRMRGAPPRVLRVAVPPWRRVRSDREVAVVRRPVDPLDRTHVDGLPVASRPYAVVDAAAELPLAEGAHLVDQVLLTRGVTLAALRAAHRRRMGRPGSAVVARLLLLAGGGARSEAERKAHRALRAAGVVGWVADHPLHLDGFGRAVLDIAFPGVKVVVEVDGWAYHRELQAFRRDAARQNALVLAGWTVLRVTWHDLVDGRGTFVAAVRRALHATKITT